METKIVYYLCPIFAIAIAIELYLLQSDRQYRYSGQESLTSLAIFLGHHLIQIVFVLIPAGLYSFAWQYRLWDIPLDRWWSIPLLFISLEFCYYWYHRSAHKIRWLWATHAVHHSVQYFNFSAAYRLGWTSLLSGNVLFFLPLIWLGFPPLTVGMGLSLNLTYQFWIHTELIPKLGILEWVFNTPSHHRVHHASNREYLDRNYGGVLIIFDRLFGTFTEEKPAVKTVYGLTNPIRSHHLIAIVFHEWVRLLRDVIQSKTCRDRLRAMFGAPT
jgi:sterol desaturase/sphingolipid hydroxylase (fatty acid hydroxylase superfamily)